MSFTSGNSLAIPVARTGSVALPSGTWGWVLDVDGDRFRLRFQDNEEPGNRMLAYCRRVTVSPEVVAAHAREPVYRSWVDAEGVCWNLRPERPFWIWTGAWPEVKVGSGLMWLVFERGNDRCFAWIPPLVQVGELTDLEILRLMNNSEPLPLPESSSFGESCVG